MQVNVLLQVDSRPAPRAHGWQLEAAGPWWARWVLQGGVSTRQESAHMARDAARALQRCLLLPEPAPTPTLCLGPFANESVRNPLVCCCGHDRLCSGWYCVHRSCARLSSPVAAFMRSWPGHELCTEILCICLCRRSSLRKESLSRDIGPSSEVSMVQSALGIKHLVVVLVLSTHRYCR